MFGRLVGKPQNRLGRHGGIRDVLGVLAYKKVYIAYDQLRAFVIVRYCLRQT